MDEAIDWRPTNRFKACGGIGTRVERAGQLGFAKLASIEKEKLAADLAQLVNAPVPHVEISKIGRDRCAISYVHGPGSRSLACFEPKYPAELHDALRTASSLLPFLAWLQSYDHTKDENFVVDHLENNLALVRAIDFEHAFDWQAGEDKIIPPKPLGLTGHINRTCVGEMLTKIEKLRPEQVAICCEAFDLLPMARVLQSRQPPLRQAMDECGWL